MWKSVIGCEYYQSNDFEIIPDKFIRTPKFALFDLDKTLITPKNGRNPYSLHLDSDSDNFILLGDKSEIYGLLHSLKAKNYIIAIVTNQSRYTDLLFNKIERFREDMENTLGWSP